MSLRTIRVEPPRRGPRSLASVLAPGIGAPKDPPMDPSLHPWQLLAPDVKALILATQQQDGTLWSLCQALSATDMTAKAWRNDALSWAAIFRYIGIPPAPPITPPTTVAQHMIRWLGQWCALLKDPKGSMQNAAREGDLDVMRWLKDRGDYAWDNPPRPAGADPRFRSEAVWNSALRIAAFQNQREAVRWLIEDAGATWVALAAREAAGKGHLDLLKWLYAWMMTHRPNEQVQFGNRFRRDRLANALLGSAAFGGRIEVMEWLLNETDADAVADTLAEMADGGKVDAMQWLYDNHRAALAGHDDEWNEALAPTLMNDKRAELLTWLWSHGAALGIVFDWSAVMEEAAELVSLASLRWFADNKFVLNSNTILRLLSEDHLNDTPGEFDTERLYAMEWAIDALGATHFEEALSAAAAQDNLGAVQWLIAKRVSGTWRGLPARLTPEHMATLFATLGGMEDLEHGHGVRDWVKAMNDEQVGVGPVERDGGVYDVGYAEWLAWLSGRSLDGARDTLIRIELEACALPAGQIEAILDMDEKAYSLFDHLRLPAVPAFPFLVDVSVQVRRRNWIVPDLAVGDWYTTQLSVTAIEYRTVEDMDTTQASVTAIEYSTVEDMDDTTVVASSITEEVRLFGSMVGENPIKMMPTDEDGVVLLSFRPGTALGTPDVSAKVMQEGASDETRIEFRATVSSAGLRAHMRANGRANYATITT